MQEVEEGKAYLVKARDNYQNYDFENRLCVRIHSALRFYSSRGGVPKPPAGNPSSPTPAMTLSVTPRVRKQSPAPPQPPPPSTTKDFVVYKETQL